jgi:Flp pilus assembly protein TadD
MLVAKFASCAAVSALAAAMGGCASTTPLLGLSATDTGAPAAALAVPGTSVEEMTSADVPGGGTPRERRRTAATGAVLIEHAFPDLAGAMVRHAVEPGAASELRLAQAFMRHGILDQASQHFTEATRLDPGQSAAWEGLARVWRDWGVLEYALGDAHRAAYVSPDSPAAQNTLGTVLLALGKGPEARARFARAAALDPGAAYAWNNRCFSWLTEGNAEAAVQDCLRALAIDPGLLSAARNLAAAGAMRSPVPAGDPVAPAKGGNHDRR